MVTNIRGIDARETERLLKGLTGTVEVPLRDQRYFQQVGSLGFALSEAHFETPKWNPRRVIGEQELYLTNSDGEIVGRNVMYDKIDAEVLEYVDKVLKDDFEVTRMLRRNSRMPEGQGLEIFFGDGGLIKYICPELMSTPEGTRQLSYMDESDEDPRVAIYTAEISTPNMFPESKIEGLVLYSRSSQGEFITLSYPNLTKHEPAKVMAWDKEKTDLIERFSGVSAHTFPSWEKDSEPGEMYRKVLLEDHLSRLKGVCETDSSLLVAEGWELISLLGDHSYKAYSTPPELRDQSKPNVA